jgi:excisionase family DNA binding protein
MAFDPYPEYLTIEQAAAYRGVPVSTIRRLLRQYGLTEFARASLNKQVLIKRTDLDEMTIEAAPPRTQKARRRSA